MKRILLLVVVAVVFAYLMREYGVEGIYIASSSMKPTLKVNAHLFVNKLIYKIRKPKRGEIVVAKSPVENIFVVKRVIAVEGDKIEIKNKKVFLNDKRLDEPYIVHTRPFSLLVDDNIGPFSIPTDHVFVMGDNRDESNDSRTWKNSETNIRIPYISFSNVKGKIFGVY